MLAGRVVRLAQLPALPRVASSPDAGAYGSLGQSLSQPGCLVVCPSSCSYAIVSTWSQGSNRVLGTMGGCGSAWGVWVLTCPAAAVCPLMPGHEENSHIPTLLLCSHHDHARGARQIAQQLAGAPCSGRPATL